MKFAHFSFIFGSFFLFFSGNTFAQTSAHQEVTSDRLRLIGRGIQDQKTGNVIALACAGTVDPISGSPSCRTLRYIKVNRATLETFYVGHPIRIDSESEPTEKDFRDAIKQANKEVKKYKHSMREDTRDKIIGYGAFAGGIGWGGYIITMSAAGATVGIGAALLPFYAFIAVVCGVVEISRRPLFPHSGMITEVMANQNGWNWAVTPQKISHRRFKWLDGYLTNSWKKAKRKR